MTTYPNSWKELKKLILWLLKQWLASCVQRVNYMKSYYLREGELKRKEEKLLLIKGKSEKKDAMIAFLKKMHPYEVPEIISLSPEEVDESYLAWIDS